MCGDIMEKEDTHMNPRQFSCLLKKIRDLCKALFSRSVAIAIGLGQLLSLLICGTAITSGLLQQQSVSIPTGQSFLNYLLLSIFFTSWLVCRYRRSDQLSMLVKNRFWKYFLLAIVDVEANYLVVKAYQYTTVTSIQLLDCIAIPTVLVLSRCFLKTRYRWMHIAGVGVCLLGAGALVLADHLSERYEFEEEHAMNKLLGDVLCLAGGILYGISNVGQEIMVSSHGSVEYLGSVAFFACFINGLQFIFLEQNEFSNVDFSSYLVFVPFIGYALCLFLFYSLMSYTMTKTSAMAVNLNLLSSDFFSLVIGLYVFQYKFHGLYFVSFGLIVFGIVLYNIYQPTYASQQKPESLSKLSSSENVLSMGPNHENLPNSSDDLLKIETNHETFVTLDDQKLTSDSGLTNFSESGSTVFAQNNVNTTPSHFRASQDLFECHSYNLSQADSVTHL